MNKALFGNVKMAVQGRMTWANEKAHFRCGTQFGVFGCVKYTIWQKLENVFVGGVFPNMG